MSAIYGVWLKQGGDMPTDTLARMSKALQHMGPDKHEECTEGNMFMGRHMFWTTPESYKEAYPACDPEKKVWVNFNGRIDYREELLEKMGLSTEEIPKYSDPEYVALAYSHFGSKEFLKHLYGDFVFALWDKSKEELILAKDRTGFKGLFYYEDDKALYYASTIEALLNVVVHKSYDKNYIIDYIIGNSQDSFKTLYKNINRVQVCYKVHCFSSGSAKRYQYYHYNPSDAFQISSAEEVFKQFKQILTGAVKERSRSKEPIAASLSGGLDSSTVCFLLKDHLPEGQEKLITYSQIQNDEKSPKDEPYINEAVAKGEFENIKNRFNYEVFKSDYDELVANADEPSHIFNIGISSLQWRMANSRGVRVYMEGFGGDMFVPYGHEILADRIKRLAILKIVKQQRASIEHSYMTNISVSSVFNRFLKFWFKQLIGNKGFVFFIRKNKALKRGVNDKVEDFYRREYNKSKTTGNEQFKLGVRTFIQSKDHLNFENVVRKFAPLEVVCPFYDVKFIEFMLSVPRHVHDEFFEPRFLYRESLMGILPEKIRKRSDKGQFLEVTGLVRSIKSLNHVKEKLPWLGKLFNLQILNSKVSMEANRLVALNHFLGKK